MTPYGEVISEVSHNPGEVRLKVTVPAGSTATVMVPFPKEKGSSAKVELADGKPLKNGAVRDGCHVTEVGQGTWEFVAK